MILDIKIICKTVLIFLKSDKSLSAWMMTMHLKNIILQTYKVEAADVTKSTTFFQEHSLSEDTRPPRHIQSHHFVTTHNEESITLCSCSLLTWKEDSTEQWEQILNLYWRRF